MWKDVGVFLYKEVIMEIKVDIFLIVEKSE